eukprot:TRINITY_DN7825_c0_g1_i3.p1 TRINITY_DN7825_c0_g1~~TRINITY_DN7825_c0_g1_i3.p1  ORF type:complete len:665 (+),score=137.97 TRINITY_DN7825_c0_g1_i3:49-2043(+)
MDIWEAVETGNVDRVALLVKQRISADTRNKYGCSPLHIACKADQPAIVDVLVKHGAQIDAQDKYGNTPLQQAVRSKTEGCIEKLLMHGAMVDLENKDFLSPLHWAARNGDVQIVRMLLSYRANPDKRAKDGEAAIHLAAASGSIETINLLLEAGANPELQDNNGRISLHYAVTSSQPAAIKLLLSRGVNWEIVDKDGRTARDIASGDMVRAFAEMQVGEVPHIQQQTPQQPVRRGEPPNQRGRAPEPSAAPQAPMGQESDILAMLQAEKMKSMARTTAPEAPMTRSLGPAPAGPQNHMGMPMQLSMTAPVGIPPGNANSDRIAQLEEALQQKTIRLHQMHDEIQELVDIQGKLESANQFLHQENESLRMQLARMAAQNAEAAAGGGVGGPDLSLMQLSMEKKDQEIRMLSAQLEELRSMNQGRTQIQIPPEVHGRLEEQQAVIMRLQQQIENERLEFMREREEFKGREMIASMRVNQEPQEHIGELKRRLEEASIQRDAESRVLRDMRVEFEELRIKFDIAQSQVGDARARLLSLDEERKQEAQIYRQNMKQYQDKINSMAQEMEQELNRRRDCETRLSIYQKTSGDLQVQSWLASQKLERYATEFNQHEIDFETLPLLTDQDLIDIGIKAIGPRRKILSQISARRQIPVRTTLSTYIYVSTEE